MLLLRRRVLFQASHLVHRANVNVSRECSSSDIPRENVPVSRFPHAENIDSLEPDVRDRMTQEQTAAGFMPNIFKVLAVRPEEFRGFMKIHDSLMKKESGTLTPAERELIIVATSAYNNCHYCVVSHSALHRIFSKNRYKADQVAINTECANLTTREKAIVKFSMKLCKSEFILDEDITDLQMHGLTQEDIYDVGAITAFFAMSNRLAHLTNMRPNEEFYTMGRVPRQKDKN